MTHHLASRAGGQPRKRLDVLADPVEAARAGGTAVRSRGCRLAHLLGRAAAAIHGLDDTPLGAALVGFEVTLPAHAAGGAAGKLGVAAAVCCVAFGGVDLVFGAALGGAGTARGAALALRFGGLRAGDGRGEFGCNVTTCVS